MAEEIDDQETLAEALSAEFDKQTAEEEPEKQSAAESDDSTEVIEEPEGSDETPVESSPPEHWSEEDKEAFLAMDESGRQWALRLEQNTQKGIEEKSKELKKFRDSIEPYRHLFPAGVDETQVIQQLLNAQAYLQRNPVEGLKWLMQNLGVDEKQFHPTDAGKNKDDDPYIDPEIRALRDEITGLKQGAEQKARDAERQRQNAMLAQVQQFRDETNEDGTPKHPHFNDVQGVMAGLLQSGRAEDMESAYEQAVWAIPEYRDSVVEQQAKERAEKELAERAKKAEDAKKKGSGVKGKKSAKAPAEPKSLADSLSEAYDKSVRGEL